jgi:dihydroorotase
MSEAASAKLFYARQAAATLLIRGAHVLDPRTGLDEVHDVLVREGRIAEIGAPGTVVAPAGATTIDATGKHLFPAFTDPHVHLRTPGLEYKETIATGTAAAAAGGYCQVLAMPNAIPVVDSVSVLQGLTLRAEREAVIPTGFLAAITVGERGEALTGMAGLSDAGAVGFTDDGKPVAHAGVLRKALQYQHLAGGVIALHEEDPTLSSDGVMHEGAVSAQLGVSGIPSISESTMIARDAELAGYEDATVHFQHVSAAESVRALATARERGVHATGEATPHHLLLTDEAVRGLDTNLKMNPPLRAERDRQAVIEALRNGVLDCIATDHAPHARHEKEVAFEEAPMGTTGLESAFAAIYSELVVPGVLPLALLIERITAGCALFGVPGPRIEPGSEANLVLVDLERSFVVGEGGYVSRAANCCFAGRSFRGQIELTVAAGQVAYAAAGILDPAPAEV